MEWAGGADLAGVQIARIGRAETLLRRDAHYQGYLQQVRWRQVRWRLVPGLW